MDGLAASLTREMTTIHKGVEAAFDQLEKHSTPIDYSADLGRIVKSLATVGDRLQAVAPYVAAWSWISERGMPART